MIVHAQLFTVVFTHSTQVSRFLEAIVGFMEVVMVDCTSSTQMKVNSIRNFAASAEKMQNHGAT